MERLFAIRFSLFAQGKSVSSIHPWKSVILTVSAIWCDRGLEKDRGRRTEDRRGPRDGHWGKRVTWGLPFAVRNSLSA